MRPAIASAAGGDDQHLLVGVIIQIVHIDEVFLGDAQFADGHGHARYVYHATAHKAYLAAKHGGGIHHHLHAVDVGGEHGHDHAALGLLEHVYEGLADFGFAHGIALALNVGGFAKEGQNAVSAKLGKAGEVGYLAVDRGIVHFKIAAENDGSGGAGNGDGNGSGNGVVHMDKAHRKAPKADFVARLNYVEGNTGNAVFL